MQANDITFGIEIETTVPVNAVSVGAYHVGSQVAGLPAGWLAMQDGSICARGGRVGCEFVSPVLKGAEGVAQVIEVVKKLKEMGAQVNHSCGFHVHVGMNPQDGKSLDRLVKLVAHFETAIYAATGTKSRETGRWCHGVRRHGDVNGARRSASEYRYHVLNLTNIASGRRPTVEFRAFAGTLNIVKILGYVRMCIALVERASESKVSAPFNPKASYPTTDRKGGAGQSALSRLFYQIGWTKGRVKQVYGDVQHAEAPTIKATKKELMRLAKQYDGPEVANEETPAEDNGTLVTPVRRRRRRSL